MLRLKVIFSNSHALSLHVQSGKNVKLTISALLPPITFTFLHFNREVLVPVEKRVSLESLASQDLEDHQDQTDSQESKGRKETPGPGGLEEALVQLEKREDEEHLVVRENLEIQDKRVFRGQWVREENPEKMAEMGLELLDLKEERETKASQDSQDRKEQLAILELKVDQAK